jgi:hypothetical protein
MTGPGSRSAAVTADDSDDHGVQVIYQAVSERLSEAGLESVPGH